MDALKKRKVPQLFLSLYKGKSTPYYARGTEVQRRKDEEDFYPQINTKNTD